MVRKLQESYGLGRDSQTREGVQGLAPTARSPAEAIVRSDAPVSLGGALGPWIVLSIRHVQNTHRGMYRNGVQENAPRGDGLIIRVRSDHHDALIACQALANIDHVFISHASSKSGTPL